MSGLDPDSSIQAMGICAVAIAFLSASQDVVFDAYRSDLLAESERGAGAAVSVLGYRLAMLVSGGLALILAEQWLGWPGTFRLMAGLFVALSLVSVWAPRLADTVRPTSPVRRELVGFGAMLAAGAGVYLLAASLPWQLLAPGRFGSLAIQTLCMLAAFVAALKAARWAGFPSFVQPWDAFFTRERAWALLALIVLYKLGDAFAGSLSTTFLIRGAGFTQTEVGAVNKVLGLGATIVGAVAGGAWLARRPLYSALMLFGVLQAASNLGFWWLATLGPEGKGVLPGAVLPAFDWGFVKLAVPTPVDGGLLAVVAFENLSGGMGTAAFVAFLMSLCNQRYTATQFALLSAFASVGRVWVGPLAGVLAESIGWPSFFIVSTVLALPALAMLWWLRARVQALDVDPATVGRSDD
jgi:PAT family beta-lactamase induction signal transducer AmpG